MAFKLSLFGPPRLLDDHGKMIAVPAKTFSLIAYLLLTSRGEPATRASLRQFFWGSSEPKTAATNLRKFLWRLGDRQEQIGFELVHIERDHVELGEALRQIDLARFQKIVSAADPADLVVFCDLYRGDLLEGIEWEEAEFGNWLQVQRANLRDALITAVASRLEPFDPDTDKIAMRIAARRLIEVDPYNEVAHRTLMRLFANEGEPARVRDVYINLQQRLSEDLGVEPDAATSALHRTLLPSWTEDVTTARVTIEPIRVPASPISPAFGADGGVFARGSGVAGLSGTPRITILPPATSGGQDLRHQFAGSLIEDVTIGLCRFKSLSVVAPHTASEFSASGNKDLASFGIDYSVETQIGIRAQESWLSVKLLHASTRRILWTDQYELNPAQTAQSYRSLSVQILSSLVDRIERSELSRYDADAQNPTSYHLYLAGQRYLRELDLPNIRRARRAFKSGLNINPEFVPALSGLARTLRLEWVLLARGDPDQLVEAERLSKRSVEIDPDDARGYRELGACTLYAGRFDESLEAFGQAEARNPQFADLLVDTADALTHAGEPQLALQKVATAMDLNPLCPDYYWWVAGGSNFHLHRYSEAIESLSRMRDQTPAFRLLAASWARMGERQQAAEYVRKVLEIHPDFSVSSWLSILPIRDRRYERDYEQGLREAGFR
jgi:DNA-binding SARP family transcriptional activator/tetratricopeptide (TPR) repeat protein